MSEVMLYASYNKFARSTILVPEYHKIRYTISRLACLGIPRHVNKYNCGSGEHYRAKFLFYLPARSSD